MGAVTYSIDPALVAILKSALPLQIFVETGTFKGHTVAQMLSHFQEIVSIELSERLHEEAAKRFLNASNVRILKGNSAEILNQLNPELKNKSILYWLDAHWCNSDGTAGKSSQCSLLEELISIERISKESVILIDDARLFLAPPLAPQESSQWPNIHQVVLQLFRMSSEHELMVLNDVILFFPKRIRFQIETFGQTHGVDWLRAMHSLKEEQDYKQTLADKERVIQEQHKAIQDFDIKARSLQQLIAGIKAELEEKEKVIQAQHKALNAYGLAYWPMYPFVQFGKLLSMLKKGVGVKLRPRLGNLNQYTPRPISEKLFQSPISESDPLPKISIVTPSYTQGNFIERTINSILGQNYSNLEYFIQDGGSLDGTIEVIKKYEGRLTGWKSERDSGQSEAINKGFAVCTGEIMGWVNSDDLLLPGALYTVADIFSRHPDVDVVYGNRLLIDEQDMEIGRWILPGHDSEILSWADFIPQETMFWRRRIWERSGGYIDESFRFAMDWDLLLRFREAGAKIMHVPRFLGAFRIHEEQKTSAVIHVTGKQEMDILRERFLGRVPTHVEIRKALAFYLIKHVLADSIYGAKRMIGIGI